MLAEECEGNKTPDLATIGFRALVSTLSSESYKTEEVITSFQPEDFATDAANEKYAELAMQIGQVREGIGTRNGLSHNRLSQNGLSPEAEGLLELRMVDYDARSSAVCE